MEGEVQFNGKSADIGSASEFAAGAEIALANESDEVAVFVLLAKDGAHPHAHPGDDDEADDQGVSVLDVGEHGADGAGEAEEGEQEEK